jgi:AcrR family transcriptional regulator
MNARRLDNLDSDRKERLFQTAADEFAEHGYDAASLNRIIEKAGIGKSSLYYYFDDKADLFTTVVERAVALLIKEIGGFDPATLTAENYWSELEGLCRRATELSASNSWYVRLGRLFYQLRGNRRERGATDRMFGIARGWVQIIVERGQELGVVRSDLPTSMLVDGTLGLGEALDRWFMTHWDEFAAEERVRLASEQLALFRRLLAPGARP